MPPRNRKVIRGQTRELIYSVYTYMKKEAEEGVHDAKQIQKRTADATGISVRTVRKILKEANSSDLFTGFRTPGKRRSGKKSVTNVDACTLGTIKRCIHNFYVCNKELPTVNKILLKLRKDIDFKGSPSSLNRIIKCQGFRWKSTLNKGRILIEKSDVRVKRIEYLDLLNQYRREGRPIVYVDEFYIQSTESKTKGQRVYAIYAGSEDGFIPNTLLMLKSSIRFGCTHNINYRNYETWFRTKLIPNLRPNSVVVLDKSPYHNKLVEPIPSPYSNKSEMILWLQKRGIPFNSTMLKPQLYRLVTLYQDKCKNYVIDHILNEYNHAIQRLPPHHQDLNPFGMVWPLIKEYVSQKSEWNAEHVMRLIEEKFVMLGQGEWSDLCKKVREIEKKYATSDHVIDALTDEVVVITYDMSDSEVETCSEEDPDTDSMCSSDEDKEQ